MSSLSTLMSHSSNTNCVICSVFGDSVEASWVSLRMSSQLVRALAALVGHELRQFVELQVQDAGVLQVSVGGVLPQGARHGVQLLGVRAIAPASGTKAAKLSRFAARVWRQPVGGADVHVHGHRREVGLAGGSHHRG